MGGLRTSEDADAVAGDAKRARTEHDHPVEEGAKIIIESAPVVAPPPRPLPQPVAPSMQPAKPAGLWLVIVVYILASAALAAAIYERFVA